MTKKVVILQGQIPLYRIPFFNRLGSQRDTALTVIYSGGVIGNVALNFGAVHVRFFKLAGLKFQLLPIDRIWRAHVVILPLDVSWLSTILVCMVRRKKSFLLWGHGFGKRRLANRVRSWMVRKSAGVILYGDTHRPEFASLTSHIFIAPNTVDVTNSGFDANSSRYTFLYVGRPQARKKIEELVEAFLRILDKIPSSISIEIVGSQNPLVAEIVKERKIEDRVRFLGEVTDDSVLKQVFHRALAYVSPGHVGLGVLHSFAYGVPVVTRREADHAPEFHNLANEKNALLYDGSISGLAAILLRLALNENLSRTLGFQGYCLYRDKRSMDIMVRGFVDAIESCK